jgi:tetratricopeptide (TPR) repeat protein
MDLWDDEACLELALRHAQKARKSGALTTLPIALSYVAAHHIFAGEFAVAAALVDEADVITVATGNVRMAGFTLLLAGWRGVATSEFAAGVRDAAAQGAGRAMASVEFAAAILHNGLGQYETALAAAQQAREHDEHGFGVWVLPEVIEAAMRLGRRDVAVAALHHLTERTLAHSATRGKRLWKGCLPLMFGSTP